MPKLNPNYMSCTADEVANAAKMIFDGKMEEIRKMLGNQGFSPATEFISNSFRIAQLLQRFLDEYDVDSLEKGAARIILERMEADPKQQAVAAKFREIIQNNLSVVELPEDVRLQKLEEREAKRASMPPPPPPPSEAKSGPQTASIFQSEYEDEPRRRCYDEVALKSQPPPPPPRKSQPPVPQKPQPPTPQKPQPPTPQKPQPPTPQKSQPPVPKEPPKPKGPLVRSTHPSKQTMSEKEYRRLEEMMRKKGVIQ